MRERPSQAGKKVLSEGLFEKLTIVILIPKRREKNLEWYYNKSNRDKTLNFGQFSCQKILGVMLSLSKHLG